MVQQGRRQPRQCEFSGFRDEEHEVESEPGTIRIAVLGDSYVEAVQVELQEHILEAKRETTERSRHSAEVMALECPDSNCPGIADVSPLRETIPPDVVVLAMTLSNDVRNNSMVLEASRVRPFFELRGEELRLNTAFHGHSDYQVAQSSTTHVKNWLINHSRILHWPRKQRVDCNSVRAQNGEAGLDVSVYKAPQTMHGQTRGL